MKKGLQGPVKAFRGKSWQLTILALFICSGVFSQVDSNRVRQNINAYGYNYKNLFVDSSHGIPRDTFTLRQSDTGSIAIINNTIYGWTQKSGILKWDTIDINGSGIDSLHIYTASDPDPDSIYTYVNGDSTLAGLIPKGGGTWGSITGTLSSQTDLQAALDAKVDSVKKRSDSVFIYAAGNEVFAFIDSAGQLSLGGIFTDPENTIYVGTYRPNPTGTVVGDDIEWEWIEDVNHVRYGFSSHIEATDDGVQLNLPQADDLHTIIVGVDESLAVSGMVSGAKFTQTWAEVWAATDGAIQGVLFLGNGAGGLSGSSLTGWTYQYTPTTATLLFTYPTGYVNPSYNGPVLKYEGSNGLHAVRKLSGLGGFGMGWDIKDFFGNVADTLAASDIFTLLGTNQVRNFVKSKTVATNNNIVYTPGALVNFWVIAVVKTDELTPGQTEITAMDSTSVGGQITLTWSASTGADTYYLDRSIHYNYGYTNVYTGANLTFDDSGLTPGTVYYYRIRSGNVAATPDRFSGWESKGSIGIFRGTPL